MIEQSKIENRGAIPPTSRGGQREALGVKRLKTILELQSLIGKLHEQNFVESTFGFLLR